MFRTIFIIFKKEFLALVKTKGFIIITATGPFLMALLMLIPMFLATRGAVQQRELVVVDQTARIFAPLSQTLEDATGQKQAVARLVQKKIKQPQDLPSIKTELTRQVIDQDIDGYVIIPANTLTSPGPTARSEVEFFARSVSDFQFNETLKRSISHVVRTIRLEDSGLEPALINNLIRNVDLKTYKVSSKGEESEDRGATFAVTYFMVFMLYVVILIYGTSISRKVVEEKTSRVIEMMVSSVKPFQLMAGKILGVGIAGLLQFSIWAGFMLLTSSYRVKIGETIGLDTSQLTGLPSLPLSVLIFFVVFFILGYLLFSTLYAAVGAMVNSEQEAQQLGMPIIGFLVLPMVMMIYIIRAPDSTTSVILSMIPFFAPTIMFMRVSIMMPPWWEVALSLMILLAAILVMVWVSGKIFRVGILMYGKRPSLPEMIKWLRYS